jgi:hypothetical protein
MIPGRRFLCVIAFLLAVYNAAYFHLSRRGDAWCRPLGLHGFLYVLPDDCEDWERWHQVCRDGFSPANEIDRALGGECYPVRSICCSGPLK